MILQCWGVFYKFGWSGKDYVEAFNFRVKISKDVKSIKEFKETIRYLILRFFVDPFYLVLRLPTATPRSQGGDELQQ